MTTRWFLGMFESGLVPGCESSDFRFFYAFADKPGLGYYLIGMWYKRSEAQKRFSLFFCSTTVAGAFGGLLASGIGEMDGLRGYRGWRWVFIIEGLLTCVVAIACFFLVGDFPEDAKWLTDDERKFAIERLATDTGKSAPQATMSFKDVLAVFKDCA